MKPILIILPSRGRPEKIEEFYNTWRQTTDGYSEVLTCLDDDDSTVNKYTKHNDVQFDIGKGNSMCDSLNRSFKKYSKYEYYFIPSDDHRMRTKKWETRFMEKIKKNGGKGVAYGNDLIWEEKLATAAFVSGNIFRALGYIALPGLLHMWVDKYWLELGKALNKLFYFPDIIVEHMHFTVGKSEVDPYYLAVNNKRVYDHDANVYHEWAKEQKLKDVKKINSFKE